LQQQQVREATRKADTAVEKATDARAVLHELSRRIEAIALANQAMLELLRERTGISDEEVLQRMKVIDLRDGTRDGQMGGQPIACPSCQRTTNTRRRVCVYCGTTLPGAHLFAR
jgi:hypothetical protein